MDKQLGAIYFVTTYKALPVLAHVQYAMVLVELSPGSPFLVFSSAPAQGSPLLEASCQSVSCRTTYMFGSELPLGLPLSTPPSSMPVPACPLKELNLRTDHCVRSVVSAALAQAY